MEQGEKILDLIDSLVDDDDDMNNEDFIIIEAKPKDSLDLFAEKFFGDITKSSALKQFGIGGGTGWVAGYMASKVGKLAAISLASTVFLFQIAQYNGYITVDWTKVRHALTKAQAKARRSLQRRKTSFLQKGMDFYQENFFLATGFAAGFLIGFIW